MKDNKAAIIKYYRKYPSKFIEDYFGICLTRSQRIFIYNTKNIKNSYVTFPRYYGMQFYYDTLKQIKKILFGSNDC